MSNYIGMKNSWLAVSLITAMVTPAVSQEILYELVDTGLLTHSVHGQGVEMRIKPSTMPQGGLEGDIIQEAMVQICRHYAPSVIPYVIEQTGISNPEFVAVRIVSGNATFGRYALQAYTLENGTCGDEL